MSVSTPAEPISVLTAGMDERKLALFRMAFRLHELHDYRLASDCDMAPQLAIVDVDSANGWQAWQQYRASYPALPALIVTAYPRDDAPAPQMLKPVRMETLFPLLRSLLPAAASAVPAGQAAAAPADPPTLTRAPEPPASVPPSPETAPAPSTLAGQAPLAAPEAAPVAPVLAPPLAPPPPLAASATPPPRSGQRRILQRFHPAGTIYGLLLEASRQRRPQRLLCEQRLLACVDPAAGQVALYTTLASVEQLCELNRMRLSCEAQEAQPLPAEPCASLPLANLQWQVALWSCRGRLLAGIDPDTPLRLRQWPNLTRLAHLPEAMRIAGLWSRTAVSLRVAVRLLKMEPANLCNFIAASHALGLLEQVDKADDSLPAAAAVAATHPAAPPVPAAQQSFLSRLLGRIKNL